MSKVFFCGDAHGAIRYIQRVVSRANLMGASHVIQLGDFGIWPIVRPNKETGGHAMVLDPFPNAVSDVAVKNGVPVYFIRGNHEWWPWLKAQEDEHGWKDPIEVFPSLFYCPNGCTFVIDGKTFGVLGGAFSVDHKRRVPEKSWWPEELPTQEEVDRLGTLPLDVLLTHDGPEQLAMFDNFPLPAFDEVRNGEVRRLIRQAIRNTHPRVLLHGHLHVQHSSQFNWFEPEGEDSFREHSTSVFGLAHDGDPERACAQMDTQTRVVTFTDICRD
jgi:predicted phosphodiesterase